MKLIQDEEIAKIIEQDSPIKIAVAYLGRDWDKYIKKPKEIEEFICSSRIGTNPDSVKALAKKIKWSKVNLLPNLHSKIYILKSGNIIIGSHNLSNNAFSEEYTRLRELSILITDKNTIKQVNEMFNSYLEVAKETFPTKKDKENALNRLPRSNQSLSFKKTTEKENILSFLNNIEHPIFIAGWSQFISPNQEEELKQNCIDKTGITPTKEGFDLMGIEKKTYNNIKLPCWLITFRLKEKGNGSMYSGDKDDLVIQHYTTKATCINEEGITEYFLVSDPNYGALKTEININKFRSQLYNFFNTNLNRVRHREWDLFFGGDIEDSNMLLQQEEPQEFTNFWKKIKQSIK